MGHRVAVNQCGGRDSYREIAQRCAVHCRNDHQASSRSLSCKHHWLAVNSGWQSFKGHPHGSAEPAQPRYFATHFGVASAAHSRNVGKKSDEEIRFGRMNRQTVTEILAAALV